MLRIRKELESGYPGLKVNSVVMGITRSEEPIQIVLSSDNSEELNLAAAQLKGLIKSLPGANDVSASVEEGNHELTVSLDRAVPEFKAGIHHGKVIKAQVGFMRKEIAVHGDAINTASRIQGKCNELHRHLLVSEAFKDHLEGKFECDLEGKFTIRGKSLEMNLYSIREPAVNPAERNQKTTLALNGLLALGLGAVSTYVRIVASLFQN